MSSNRERARGRNWQKARVMGSFIHTSSLTEDEKVIAIQINKLREQLF